MERARRQKRQISPDRKPALELESLLVTITKGISSGVKVVPAKGQGFVHFEVRGATNSIETLKKHHKSISTIMKVAGRVRRTRITMQFHDQGLEEVEISGTEDLEKMVSEMSRSMADRPDDVVVFPAIGDAFIHYDVRCDRDDVGSLIGGRGAHVSAMRSLVEAAGEARGIRATIHVMARDDNS